MHLPNLRNKKGALEMSIGTVVVIVLGMTMLILGLVLVRNIFAGATHNVDIINDKVRGEISKLFSEEDNTRVVFFLPNNEAKIKKGESFGVAFGIKNNVAGESQAGQFEYKVKTGSIEFGCSLTKEQAESYIILGREGEFSLSPGQTFSRILKIRAPDTAPLCEIIYDFEVKKDNEPYETNFFIVSITG